MPDRRQPTGPIGNVLRDLEQASRDLFDVYVLLVLVQKSMMSMRAEREILCDAGRRRVPIFERYGASISAERSFDDVLGTLVEDSLPAHSGVVSMDDLMWLSRAAMSEVPGEPAHDYCLGIAYLNGIVVPKEPAVGRKMLERAADVYGSEPAERSLVALLTCGPWAERDFEAAQLWQRNLVDQRERALQERPSVEAARVCEDGLAILCEISAAVGDVDGQLAASERLADIAMEVLARAGESASAAAVRTCEARLSQAYRRVSAAALARGRVRDAIAAAGRALLLAEVVDYSREEPGPTDQLSSAYLCMGRAQLAAGMDDAALESFDTSCEMREDIYGRGGNLGGTDATADARQGVADVLIDRADWEGAADELGRVVTLRRIALQMRQTPERWLSLAQAFLALAEVQRRQDRLDEADRNALAAFNICSKFGKLRNTFTSLGYRKAICGAVFVQAEVALDRGDWKFASDLYARAAHLYAELYGIAPTREAAFGVAMCRRGMGDAADAMGMLPQARENFEAFLGVCEVAGINFESAAELAGARVPNEVMACVLDTLERVSEAMRWAGEHERADDLDALAAETNDVWVARFEEDLEMSFERWARELLEALGPDGGLAARDIQEWLEWELA